MKLFYVLLYIFFMNLLTVNLEEPFFYYLLEIESQSNG